MEDLVAVWSVALADGMHRVEFEHGTTTGRRIVRVDSKVRYFVSHIFAIIVSSGLLRVVNFLEIINF